MNTLNLEWLRAWTPLADLDVAAEHIVDGHVSSEMLDPDEQASKNLGVPSMREQQRAKWLLGRRYPSFDRLHGDAEDMPEPRQILPDLQSVALSAISNRTLPLNTR